MHLRRAALFALVLACGKSTTSEPPAPQPRTAEVLSAKSGEVEIFLERQACYGPCPVYTVTLRKDGTVDYEGRAHVAARGRHARQITPGDVEALARRLEDEGFFTMTWKDPCDMIGTDSPTAVLRVTANGRSRKIVDYHGDHCVPPRLRELEDEVDRVAGVRAFTECEGGPCER